MNLIHGRKRGGSNVSLIKDKTKLRTITRDQNEITSDCLARRSDSCCHDCQCLCWLEGATLSVQLQLGLCRDGIQRRDVLQNRSLNYGQNNLLWGTQVVLVVNKMGKVID